MEKESIFSVCKAVCVERKWVRSVTMMFIPRLHITRSCFSGGRKADLLLYVSLQELCAVNVCGQLITSLMFS